MARTLCTRYTDLLRLLIGPRRDDMVVQSPHHNARGCCPRTTGNRRNSEILNQE